jgi:hypothetical protein
MRSRVLTCLTLALTALFTGGTAAQGSGQTTVHHCVVWISPVDQTGHSTLSPMRCFSQFTRAQHYAHGPGPKVFRAATDAVATSSTTISIDYDASGFTGTTLTWTVANTAGCNGFSYSAASMPSGWNDRVSSSHSYNGCNLNRHFHDTNFLGAGIICTCSTMGTMNNQTSSESWS